MKRTLLLILLLVISIGTVNIFASSVYKEHDNVTFQEKVLYGDRSAADGLNVKLNINQSSQLFWSTVCNFGENVEVSTDYKFYSHRQDSDIPASYNGLSLFAYPEIEFSPDEKQVGLGIAYQELFDSLAPGEEKEKTVYLKDYMEYYDFEVNFNFPNYMDYGNTSRYQKVDPQELEADQSLIPLKNIREYFKIPVLETETHTISVAKHNNGYIAGTGGGSTDSERYQMESHSVMTLDTCYFTFDTHTTENNIVDTSELPDGYGIYCLPYETLDDSSAIIFSPETVKTDQISMVYALDPSVKLHGMEMDDAQTKIFLYTVENEELWLTVIDIETMTALQKFKLVDMPADAWPYICNYTDFIAVFDTYNEEVSLFSLNAKEEYELQFICPFQPEELEEFYWYPEILAYDGERLACTGTLRNYSRGNKDYCDFYVMIYDKEGLQYLGRFDNNLDSGLDGDWYDYPCKADYYNAIEISW